MSMRDRGMDRDDIVEAGEAEVATLSPASPRPPCLKLRVSQARAAPRGDGVHPYTIEPMSQ